MVDYFEERRKASNEHLRKIGNWCAENRVTSNLIDINQKLDQHPSSFAPHIVVTLKYSCGTIVEAHCGDSNAVKCRVIEDHRPPRLQNRNSWAGDF